MNMNEMQALQKRQSIGMLEIACRQLELSPAQYEQMEARYTAVAEHLSNGEHPALVNASIYPQGSVRHRTTVKPIGRNEFDVDLVCHLPSIEPRAPVNGVHALVGKRLKDHGTYRDMLEPINRGWRLNYANEFHLDITPAIPEFLATGDEVLVPDRKLECWKESNPKGYAVWFDRIAALTPVRLAKYAEARADVEPLPENEPLRGPLRRIVQIGKRHRDLFFSEKPERDRSASPISIIITTLAALAYECIAMAGASENEFDLVLATSEAMPRYVQHVPGVGFWIPNPSNPRENFAEKWNQYPERATAFFEWHGRFITDVLEFLRLEGIDRLGKHLSRVLGDGISRKVLAEYTNRVNQHRLANGLSVTAKAGVMGVVSSPAVAVPTRQNVFFGR